MPKVSINILTKDRLELLKQALTSVFSQSFKDWELVIINNGSSDATAAYLAKLETENQNVKVINQAVPLGITRGRQAALNASLGQYVAILDDDDEWADPGKLQKQVDFFQHHQEYVLVGGAISIKQLGKRRGRPENDRNIRQTMLLRNNFFTSTVMFKKSSALEAGGFISDEFDLGEDYDLWLRLGRKGKLYNFTDVFASYRQTNYNIDKKRLFFKKQLALINRNKAFYSNFYLAWLILKIRLWL